MANQPSPQAIVDQLVGILTLAPEGEDVHVAPPTPAGGETGKNRIFGGQVIAQALMAASATVPDDRPVHSLHAYFLRMGSDALPVSFAVERDLDGGSFSNRRVMAEQQGRKLLSLSASFHRREASIEHQDAMPAVAGPDGIASDVELRRAELHLFPEDYRPHLARLRPIELRTVENLPWVDLRPAPAVMHTWLRAIASPGNDPVLHRALLAYASDLAMMRTAALPHALSWFSGEMLEASLDHAMWFHDDCRIDDWLLFRTESHWAANGRAVITGQMWRRDGRLVASVAQEGMIRLLKPRT